MTLAVLGGPEFAGGEDRRRQVRLEVALPAGATFTRASTKSRAVESGGAPVVHAVDVPVFEWVVARGRRCLSVDRPGADPTAGDFLQVPLLGGSSAAGGVVGVDLAPQFAAAVRVGQGDDDVVLRYGPLDLRWSGTRVGGAGAEAGIQLYDTGAAAILKELKPRHAAGDLLRVRLHWGGGYAPHLQVNGWAKICEADVSAFAAPGSVGVGCAPGVGLQCPTWVLDLFAAVGRQTPERLFAVAGDSISDEQDELAPTIEPSNWERTFGARLFASEGGYVLAEGVSGRQIIGWHTDTRLTDSNATDIVIHCGTNDINAGRTLVQMQGDLVPLVGQVLAAGKRCHVCTLPPAGFDVAEQVVWNGFNAWLLSDPVALAGVTTIIDSGPSIADPGDPTNILPAYAYDAIHPNDVGAAVLGNRIADLLEVP